MSNIWSDASAAWNEAVQPRIEDAEHYGSTVVAAGAQGVSELGALIAETGGALLEQAGYPLGEVEEWLSTLSDAERAALAALFQTASTLRSAGNRLADADGLVRSVSGRPIGEIFTPEHRQNGVALGGAIRETLNAASVVMQALNATLATFPGEDLRQVLIDVDPRFARWLDNPGSVTP